MEDEEKSWIDQLRVQSNQAQNWVDENRQKGIDTAAQAVDNVVTGTLEDWNVPGAQWIGDRSRNITGLAADLTVPESWEIPLYIGAQVEPTPLGEAAIYGAGRINKARRLLKSVKGKTLTGLKSVVESNLSKVQGAVDNAFSTVHRHINGHSVYQDAGTGMPIRIDGQDLNLNIMQSTTTGGSIPPFSTITSKVPTTFTGNNLTSLNDFIKAGNAHASGLLNQGKKKNLLKGFNNKIVDDNGVEFMLQRGPNNTFKVTSVYDAEMKLLRQSGYTGTAKEMQALRSQINRELGQRPGTRYWDILAEGDKDTYIEHLVAKGQDWFWELKDKDPNFAPWINPNRNSAFNLRILNNRRWKALKDRVEQIIYPSNYIDGGTSTKIVDGKTVYTGNLKPLEARVIIAAEDPLTSISGKVVSQQDKKLMGHLVIKRATTGETIGKIPEYLQDLYSPSFKYGFNKNLPELIKNGIVKKGESLDDFRTRFLNERIDFIIDEAPLLHERAQKIIHKYAGHSDPLAAAKSAVIDEAVLEDLTRFKAIFPWLRVQPGMMKHYIQNAKY